MIQKNIAEGKELCESMKKSAKYKWLRRLEKNPEKVASVGDNVVKPWYLKLIAHRERMIEKIEGYSKPIPPAKFSFFQSRRVPWHQASHTLSEQGLMTSLAVWRTVYFELVKELWVTYFCDDLLYQFVPFQ